MTDHEFDVEIGDYVDGTLASSSVAALEAHLAGCPRCQLLAADFRAVRAAAVALPTRTPPPRVWARIAAELESPAHGEWAPADLSWRSAIAAGVLLSLLGTGSWLSWRQVAGSREPQRIAYVEVARDGVSGGPAHTEAAAAMQAEITNLQRLVRADSAILPAETKAVFDAASTDIDNAIEPPRAVLYDEPSNELARVSLFEALRSKLALLQEMISLINQMRQGNQDEAARIVSGMQP